MQMVKEKENEHITTLKEVLDATWDNVSKDFSIGKINREQRRHGLLGKRGYERSKKNKKLYEY